jgi:transposase-like protein
MESMRNCDLTNPELAIIGESVKRMKLKGKLLYKLTQRNHNYQGRVALPNIDPGRAEGKAVDCNQCQKATHASIGGRNNEINASFRQIKVEKIIVYK